MTPPRKAPQATTIIYPAFGRVEFASGRLSAFLQASKAFRGRFEWVFVCDGPDWGTTPLMQDLPRQGDEVQVKVLPEACHRPARLLNAGLAAAVSDRVIFWDPEILWSAEAAEHLLSARPEEPVRIVVAEAGLKVFGYPHGPSPGQVYPWLLNGPFQPLSYCSVARSAAEAVGGFDESSLLQRDSGLDFLLRLTRRFQPVIAGTVPGTADVDSHSLDIAGVVSVASKDVARRYAARAAPDPRIPQGREPEFLADLNRRERERLSPLLSHFELASRTRKAAKPRGVDPLRITVATGPWDYHHNWLCFYNYLEYLQGSGFATHKTVLDARATEQDVSNSDVVILSRAKSDNVADIIKSCRSRGIPTIYMIDDNWFSVGKDWPEQYSELFADDGPIMRNFLAGVEGADAVLTYNPLLAEDLAPHARKVVTLPNSVDIERFDRVPRGQARAEFVIGYAGSPRFSDAAFEALAQVARMSNVQVALLGELAPRQLALFKDVDVIRRAFTDYENYLKTLRELRLDILLAPLDFSRTSRSKCPNKYLEITAAGGIGVYSKVEPYTWYVEDGRNGILVADSEDRASWRDAIVSLMDRARLDRLHAAARADVLENYSSRKVAGQFADMLSTVLQREVVS